MPIILVFPLKHYFFPLYLNTVTNNSLLYPSAYINSQYLQFPTIWLTKEANPTLFSAGRVGTSLPNSVRLHTQLPTHSTVKMCVQTQLCSATATALGHSCVLYENRP